ncbi:hypothetical protein [Microbacterium sp. Leaf320]|uniref:hypothetical protein n=1 Tax=Microbacterium sp. Leaf320 TaxID=1736334 RepID=UPI000A4A3CBD|nr:hypothetical protein [Microbacterium sp. Leaf320]
MIDQQSGAAERFPPIDLLLSGASDFQTKVSALNAREAGAGNLILGETVAPGIVSTLNLDEPQRYVLLTRTHLEGMRLSPELARTGALARLRMAANDLRIEGIGGRFRVWTPAAPDLTASLMLVADTWLNNDAINGAPVFAAGGRTSLYVCGANDHEALEDLRQIAEKRYRASAEAPQTEGLPLTRKLLTLREDKLTELDV